MSDKANHHFASLADIYLIGTVMLVFGMGLYELFISNLDVAKTSVQRSNLLGLFQLRVCSYFVIKHLIYKH